jgi:hypothetical protein
MFMEIARLQTKGTVNMDDLFVCQIVGVQPICNFNCENSNFICENASVLMASRDSVVRVANRYGMDGPRIESQWGEIFRFCPDRPWGKTNFLSNGYRVIPGAKANGACPSVSTPSSAEVKERLPLSSFPP